MSKIRIKIIDHKGRVEGGVSTGEKCVYCGSPAVIYVWCRRHFAEMGLVKKAVYDYVKNKNRK
jgi:hypothetical protein